MSDAIDERILQWCNSIRVRLGLRRVKFLLKGRPGFSRDCPLCRTIRGKLPVKICVGPDCFGVVYNGVEIAEPMPLYVQVWLDRFDRRKLGYYILHSRAKDLTIKSLKGEIGLTVTGQIRKL